MKSDQSKQNTTKLDIHGDLLKASVVDFITPLNKNESFAILPNIFEGKKPFLLLEIPYCEPSEIASKRFIKKFHQFTGEIYDVAVKWLTKKVKSLFHIKRPYFTSLMLNV